MTTSFIAADVASWTYRSGRSGGRRARRRLGGESLLDEPVDEREQSAERIARRTDAIRAHERRIQARDVGLDDACRNAGGEEVQCGAAVRRAIASSVRGQRGSCAQIRANEQRVDDARCRAGVGQALVSARRHARERERGAAEHLGQRGDLVDVGGGVAPNAIRIGAIDGVDLIAANQLAIRPSDAKVSRDGLQSVAGKLAGREVVSTHCVERVDELASGRDEPNAPATIVAARNAASRRSLSQSADSEATQGERHAKRPRSTVDEGQVEAVQVVILDHVRIGGDDRLDEAANEIRLAGVAASASPREPSTIPTDRARRS